MILLAGITTVAIISSGSKPYLAIICPVFYLIGVQSMQPEEYLLASLVVVFIGGWVHEFINKLGKV